MGKHEKFLEVVKVKMDPDERILFSVYGTYTSKASKIYGTNGVLAVTPRRIVFYTKGFLGEQFESLSISAIIQIEKKKVGIFQLPAGFTFSTSKSTYTMVNIRKEKDINGFIDQINQRLAQIESTKIAEKKIGESRPMQDIISRVSIEEIGNYINEENIFSLLKIFMQSDWDTRETVSAAFLNLQRNEISSTAEYKNAIHDMLQICEAESTGGSYRQNCIETLKGILDNSET